MGGLGSPSLGFNGLCEDWGPHRDLEKKPRINSRLEKVGTWRQDDLCDVLGFGVGGWSYSNFLASTVGIYLPGSLYSSPVGLWADEWGSKRRGTSLVRRMLVTTMLMIRSVRMRIRTRISTFQ